MPATAPLLLLLLAASLGGCDVPPAHSALYPPDEEALKQTYIITHDRYRPWAFQPVDPFDGR